MKKISFLLALGSLLFACQSNSERSPQLVSQPIPEKGEKFVRRAMNWEKKFYKDEGWFGGDGIFTIPLNGKEFVPAKKDEKVLFIYSDSLIKLLGKIKDGQIKNKDYKMIHNSMSLMEGIDPDSPMEFYWKQDENGAPHSVFEPHEKYLKTEDYFWMGDGFVNTAHDSTLYLFCYRVRDVWAGEFFPFEQMDVSIIKIDKDEPYPYTNHEIIETDLMYKLDGKFGKTTFGNAVLVNTEEAGAPHPDGYIYIYGIMGYHKELIVARALPKDFEHVERWTYWDGEDWNSDKTKVDAVTKNTANELSMTPLSDGRFMLVTHRNGLEPYIDIQMAKSPWGPFYPKKQLWYCDEVEEDKDIFAYNAKGHPSISPDGKLLVTYNINSFDFFVDVLKDAHHYRPRWIIMDLD